LHLVPRERHMSLLRSSAFFSTRYYKYFVPTELKIIMELTIRVLCTDLPGKDFGDATHGEGRQSVHVGIQCREDVIDIVPGDAKSAEFAPVFKVAPLSGDVGGLTNFTGPFAKGTKNQRFFYLSWGELKSIHFQMFRRAKIHLSHLTWEQVEKAAKANKPITVHLSLTDRCGWPLCASVKPPYVKWDV
jgi:hypothetical protein